jgi:hypothetical protein
MSATNRGAKRAQRDAYPTPTWCTEAIVRQIVWGPEPWVFEPCAGDGSISEVLRSMHLSEQLSENDIDWDEGYDFLDYGDVGSTRFDFIITNPPFSLAQEFVTSRWRLPTE